MGIEKQDWNGIKILDSLCSCENEKWAVRKGYFVSYERYITISSKIGIQWLPVAKWSMCGSSSQLFRMPFLFRMIQNGKCTLQACSAGEIGRYQNELYQNCVLQFQFR